MILPLGLRVGAIVDVLFTKTKLTNRQDRIYLVETYAKISTLANRLPSLCTTIRVLPFSESPEVGYSEERLSKRNLDLLRTIPQSFIWSLFSGRELNARGNQKARSTRLSVSKQKHCRRPGLNTVMRLDVTIVRILYIKIKASGENMSPFISSSTSLKSCDKCPCSWYMSCIVDDGTGQATLNVDGRSLVCGALLMEHTEACNMENLARAHPDAVGGGIEYSDARRFQRAQHIYGIAIGQSQMANETPAMALSRRVDNNSLLRPITVYCTLRQNISQGTESRNMQERSTQVKRTSSIEIGNQTTVQTMTVPRLNLDAIEIEEPSARSVTLSAWRVLMELRRSDT